MATDSGGRTKKKQQTTSLGPVPYVNKYEQVSGVDDPNVLKGIYTTNTSGQEPFALDQGMDNGGGTDQTKGDRPAAYTTATGVTSDYVGNQFLDNPAAAVNNIMQGLGLSVSSNSPFYNQMQQLAPGLEWLQYFGSGTGDPGGFLGNVGDWFNQGTGGLANAFTGLGGAMSNFMGGGNSPELAAMIDNMTPEDITRALGAMMETGMYGSAGSRVRQGLQSRLLDTYNQFIGNQPSIEAGLGAGQTIADAFRDFMNSQNVLGSLGF